MKSRRKSVKSIWLSSLLLIDAEYLLSKEHCVKSVWKRSYFWSVFSYIWTEYGDSRNNLRIQSEYRKIRTGNNSVFGHFSRSRTLHLYMIKIRHGYQIHRLQNYLKIVYVDKKLALRKTLHKKWNFPLRISSVNVTKSAGNCGFGHIYWRNLNRKTSFFVQWKKRRHCELVKNHL